MPTIPDSPKQEVSGGPDRDAVKAAEPVGMSALAANGLVADPIRGGMLEVADPGPDEDLISSWAEERLKEWCAEQGITPKHLERGFRNQMRTHFSMEVRQTFSDMK